MIGKLKGKLDFIADDRIILDVNGVGYELHCSGRTLAALPKIGDELALAVETHVRETEIRLFGFANENDRQWFCLLQNVQGVGAKVALALLGAFSPDELSSAIAMQDKAMLTRTPGIGAKVAQRIITELKDKIPKVLGGAGAGAAGTDAPKREEQTAASDAVSALVNLGYPPMQANLAIQKVLAEAGENADAGTLIRLGLRELSG